MALVVYDRVLQTGTANTTVSFSLSGTVTGYQSFAVVGDGNTTYYSATDGTNWETGLGTYASSGTVLTRTTVLQSSNSGSAVTFSGTVTVWIDYTASKSIYKDANGNISAGGGSITNATWAGSVISSTYLPTVTLGSTAVTLGTTVATFAGMTLNSPTFVTPVLGTPSSGTLTSCTGLPNAGLVNSSVTIGSTAVSLGTTVATFAGVTLSSPTFVTPVLGTPSSGTLSSCSGYNSNSLSGVTLASTVITSSLTSVGSLGNTQIASLGVGTAASGTSGEIRATNNVTAYYSDDRMKINLGNIPNALDKLKTLNGFYYEANELAQSMGYEVKKEVGVSAQQVQAIMPEVVAPAPIDDKYLTVRYERLVPLLIEAIKELESQVAELKAK